jgi:hypothetical protein
VIRDSSQRWHRPIGRAATAVVVAVLVLAPAWLFADPLGTYRLHSDDFEYLAASRSLGKALGNLYRAHNTHIVPAWRLLTWGVVRASGSLANLPRTLALVSFGALAGLMGLAGWLVARESRRAWLGLAAFVAAGTTSVMESSATWYSSGQTIWAAIGVLGVLASLQGWRARGGWWRLGSAAAWAYLAGGFWTVGHVAGPAGAAYLLADGRRRCLLAALLPIGATGLSVALAAALGGGTLRTDVRLERGGKEHGVDFAVGAMHTLQSVPEDLVIQNLGLAAETTFVQAAALLGVAAIAWAAGLARARRGPSPLEAAGLVMVFASYFVEWSFRGYLPFFSLRGVVPWYDTIPHVGLVLFGSGWFGRALGPAPGDRIEPLRRGQALGVLALSAALVLAHGPRVEALFEKTIPPECWGEVRGYLVTPELRLAATRDLAAELARRQRLDLARLDQAEELARRLGIGHRAIASAFGRVEMLELPEVYDANGLLDIPESGPVVDPAQVRVVLGGLLHPRPLPVLGLDRIGGFRFVE